MKTKFGLPCGLRVLEFWVLRFRGGKGVGLVVVSRVMWEPDQCGPPKQKGSPYNKKASKQIAGLEDTMAP